MIKNVLIVGLGLIGASFAKAFKKYTDIKVYGFDKNFDICQKALLENTIDGILEYNENNLKKYDLIIISLYNNDIIKFVENNKDNFKENAIVMDTGGLKTEVCKNCFKIAAENNFTFIGGHPMAGKAVSGYENSEADLFIDASMILVPPIKFNIAEIKDLFKQLQFKYIVNTTAEEHDRRIAFTSELPHIISASYIKSPVAHLHAGFSAGSYQDMSRVSSLNADMWSEIFLANKENVLAELNCFIENLEDIKNAIEKSDKEDLRKLLAESSFRKVQVEENATKKYKTYK